MSVVFETRHDAVVYDDDEELTARVVAMTQRAVADGGHTMIVLPDRVLERVRARLPTGLDGGVELGLLDGRFRRPVDAVEQVWRFVADRLRLGVTHVLAVRELPVMDRNVAPAWVWCESSILEVFRPLAVHSVCVIDRRTSEPEQLGELARAHDDLSPIAPMPLVRLSTSAPAVALATMRSVDARRVISRAAEACGETVAEAAAVVVSELVTNAVRHGGTPAQVEVWTDSDSVSLTVTDDGPGLHDPTVGLRPPDLPLRGAGLWLCTKLADEFSVHNVPDRGCQARARFHTGHRLGR